MFSCVCIKMSKTLSAKYYQESKERLRYQNLSKEDKKKKQLYGHEYFKNL